MQKAGQYVEEPEPPASKPFEKAIERAVHVAPPKQAPPTEIEEPFV